MYLITHMQKEKKKKNSYRESASGREKERQRYRAPYVCKYDVNEMQSNSVSDNMDVCPPTRTTQASKHKPPHGTSPVLFAPVPIAVKWSEFVPQHPPTRQHEEDVYIHTYEMCTIGFIPSTKI